MYILFLLCRRFVVVIERIREMMIHTVHRSLKKNVSLLFHTEILKITIPSLNQRVL